MTATRFPQRKVRGVSEIVSALVDIIQKNIVAKANVTSNVLIGSNVVPVENAFHFRPDEEIVLIDYGYNNESSQHYQVFEYAKIKEVNNTHSVTLASPVQSDWLLSEHSFIQKTIGHSPLYDNNVFYGDRDVISADQISVTVEPQSLSNEWLYIQGGLAEEYRIQITIYGKSIKMGEGKIILDKYADAIYQLLNENMHFNATDSFAPLMASVAANATSVVIEDTPENREIFVPSTSPNVTFEYGYGLQDNSHWSRWLSIGSVTYGSGLITVNFTEPITDSFSTSEYAVLRRTDRYFYDSRVDGITYGQIQKGSAFLRAAQLNWYCKWVNDFQFPQTSSKIDYFKEK